MESNKPLVGGEEPKQDVSQNPNHHAESTNGTTSATLPPTANAAGSPHDVLSDQGAAPDAAAAMELASDTERHSEAHATHAGSVDAGVDAHIGTDPVGSDTGNNPPEANHQHQDDADYLSDDESERSPESMQEMLEHGEHDERGLKKGDIVEGVVAQTTPTEIMVELEGNKSGGVISGKELERMDKETLERLKVGEKVLAYVLNPEDKNGNVVLSLGRAAEEQDWRRAEEFQQSAEVFLGKVDGYNKGGLIVRFGRVRGFVPESQVSRDRRRRAEGSDPQEKWASMRGEEITVKVLEVDRSRNRLILSEREAAPQMREQQKEKLMDELQVGDVRTGRVKSLADFGAFVDVGGADGLVHLTELSWKHVTHPRELLKVGQQVEVEVISVDRDRKRIGLSMKRREEDPWMVIARQYQIGQLVQGTITKLTKFGAFARLVDNPEIEGLIHISELATHRVNHPKEVVNEGESLALRIVKIDPNERRMGLSLKRVSSPEYLDADFTRGAAPAPEPPAATRVVNDYVDYEAATLKDEDRRRQERRKGNKKGKRGGKGGEFDDEFEGDDGEY